MGVDLGGGAWAGLAAAPEGGNDCHDRLPLVLRPRRQHRRRRHRRAGGRTAHDAVHLSARRRTRPPLLKYPCRHAASYTAAARRGRRTRPSFLAMAMASGPETCITSSTTSLLRAKMSVTKPAPMPWEGQGKGGAQRYSGTEARRRGGAEARSGACRACPPEWGAAPACRRT